MSDIDWELVFRYYGGECSTEERRRFEEWLAADSSHAELVEALRAASDRALRNLPTPRPEPAISRRPSADGLRPHRYLVALAASVALIAAGAVSLWMTRPAFDTRPLPTAMHVTTTRRGQQATVRLPDGSSVTLSAASRLRYPADFGERATAERQVELEGEAYFDVVHDNAHPFRVRAGGAVAEDIGTTFGIRAYRGEGVRVVVASGSVSFRAEVSTATSARVLKRGDQARVAAHGELSVTRVDPDRYFAWTRGELVFDQAPLSDVAAQLGRWYDVDVELADASLAGRDFSGAFRDEPVDEVIDVLAAAAHLRAERHGRSITLFARPRR